ncbi:MAG TPA: FHA domain-containing protein [Polyangiales bacterium]
MGSTESWARLRLVQGESTAQAWELVASLGQTTLTVGSGPQSTWQVRAEGVRPIHLTFHWDGATLRVADLGASGDVRVDGLPVGIGWVNVAGHARLEFGTAVLMVDTSAPRVGESDHPLDPAQLTPAAFGEPASGAVPRLHKATLLGVAASDLPPSPRPAGESPASGLIDAAQLVARGAQDGSSSEVPDAGGDFRLVRPSDSERLRKATLLGAAISVPPPAPVPDSAPVATPSRGLSTGTLMGVINPLDLRFPRPTASESKPAPAADRGDVRTIIGMPMSDATMRSAIATAATQTDLRPLSPVPGGAASPGAASAPPERIASTWHEDAGSARSSVADVERDPYASGSRPVEHGRVSPAQGSGVRGSAGSGPFVPPDARVPSVDGPKRSFPLQYIGIVVLTCAAYFAWLYLLDHW